MKLSQQNIQFIDNYLKHNNVIYYDIRLEMLDHIAISVEQKMQTENLNFYNAFKSYMAINKKELTKQNKTGNLSFDCFSKFGKFLIQPFQLLVFGLSFFTYYLLLQTFRFEPVFLNSIHVILFGIIILCGFEFFYVRVYKKKRFYAIEQTGSILFFIYQTGYFFKSFVEFRSNENNILNLILISIYVGLFMNFFGFYITENLKFKRQNQLLFQ